MFFIIEFYHSGLIQSLVDGYLHLIYTSAFLYSSPWHSILILISLETMETLVSLCVAFSLITSLLLVRLATNLPFYQNITLGVF